VASHAGGNRRRHRPPPGLFFLLRALAAIREDHSFGGGDPASITDNPKTDQTTPRGAPLLPSRGGGLLRDLGQATGTHVGGPACLGPTGFDDFGHATCRRILLSVGRRPSVGLVGRRRRNHPTDEQASPRGPLQPHPERIGISFDQPRTYHTHRPQISSLTQSGTSLSRCSGRFRTQIPENRSPASSTLRFRAPDRPRRSHLSRSRIFVTPNRLHDSTRARLSSAAPAPRPATRRAGAGTSPCGGKAARPTASPRTTGKAPASCTRRRAGTLQHNRDTGSVRSRSRRGRTRDRGGPASPR